VYIISGLSVFQKRLLVSLLGPKHPLTPLGLPPLPRGVVFKYLKKGFQHLKPDSAPFCNLFGDLKIRGEFQPFA
jgi:hypothetical protein